MRIHRPVVLALLLTLACSGTALAANSATRSRPVDLDALPLHLAPAPSTASSADPVPHNRERLAQLVPMNLGLADGSWSGSVRQAIWRTRVDAPGAVSLGLRFSELALPESAGLRLLSPDDGRVLASYEHRDISSQGRLWTALVPGERLVVELIIPAVDRDAVKLSIDSVMYGAALPGIIAKSGDCNIDVICSQGNAWRDEIRSAVLVQYQEGNFIYSCSGTLMNNTAEDDTPLLLSAYHCDYGGDHDESAVVYFNFQSSSCGGTPDGSKLQTVNGTQLLASDSESDFALLQLSSSPPSCYNAYLAGWRVAGDPAQSGAGIHHPSGDEKRISVFSAPLTRQTADIVEEGQPDQRVAAWVVTWAQGTTEAGSSGSGLWDQNAYVLGVLSGGDASCSNPDGEDYYGRLEVAWDNGLATWLDPLDSGATVQPGKELISVSDPDNSPPLAVDDAYAVNVPASASDTISYSIDALDNDSDPDGDTLSITGVDNIASSTGTLVVSGDQIIYMPTVGFNGSFSFDYAVADCGGGAASATVTVEVTDNRITDDEDDGDGGGAWSLGSLLGLLGLAALRRRRA